MNFIKRTALLLCAAALILTSAACGTTAPEDTSEAPPTEETSPEVSEPPVSPESGDAESFDYAAAYAAFEPDTVILTAGGYDITWGELFFYICDALYYLDESFDNNWSGVAYDNMTYSEMVLEYAVEQALSYKSVHYGANLLGVTLSDTERASIADSFANASQELGGEEALLEQLSTQSHIYSRELFEYLLETEMLIGLCFSNIYGEDGSKVSDDLVAELVNTLGYLKAKHILIKKAAEAPADGGKSAEQIRAEDILSQLDGYTGNDFDAFFDELMLANSEDTGGVASYPGGYLFEPATMDPAFSEGCAALEIGSYSRLVEGYYGYHIIYRLPLDYNEAPYEYSSQGYVTYTLRYLAAADEFNYTITDWIDSLEVTYSDVYNSLSLGDVFSSGTSSHPQP